MESYKFHGHYLGVRYTPETEDDKQGRSNRLEPRTSYFKGNKEQKKGVFFFRFGAITFYNYSPEERAAELKEIYSKFESLPSVQTEQEEFVIESCSDQKPKIEFEKLVLDHVTHSRAEVVAQTVAQSVTMEYYEKIVENIWQEVSSLVKLFFSSNRFTLRKRAPLIRSIGRVIEARNEVVGALHYLDRPDLIWEDPIMDQLYDDLRLVFDLPERYQALEYKLKTTQDTLELLMGMRQDRQLFFLESAIVFLILLEVVVGFIR